MAFINLVLIATFVLLRTAFDPWMRSLDIWLSYGVETSLCLIFIALNRHEIQHGFKIKRWYGWHLFLSLVWGAIIALLGLRTGKSVPFDFTQASLWLQLVIIAPLLEEAIFRLMIWNTLRRWIKNGAALIAITSVLFSLSHFAAYFYVPEEFKSFVVFQSIYTLFLAIYWGAARFSTGSWLAGVVLHFAVNLSFGLTHYTVAKLGVNFAANRGKTLKILVVDMPMEDLGNFKELKSSVPIYSIVGGDPTEASTEVAADCARTGANVDKFFAAEQSHQPMNFSESDLDLIGSALIESHGYHVLGLVQDGLKNSEIYTLGMTPPPDASGIRDPKAYIETSIYGDLGRLQDTIDELNPDIVVMASSETFEENYSDLMRGGFSDSEAKKQAKRIFAAWTGSWSSMVSGYPDTLFIVPSGNGGVDGKGDNVEAAEVMPASLLADNLIKVASTGPDGCLSEFSNYDPVLVDVTAPGELVESWAPCSAKKSIKISGTSQAAAVFANRLARELERGTSKLDFLHQNLAPLKNCLVDKIKYGSVPATEQAL